MFDDALTDDEVTQAAAQLHLTGAERALVAGYSFGRGSGATPALTRPTVLSDGAWTVDSSVDRNSDLDAGLLPMPSTQFMHLPLAEGSWWNVIQGFDNASGSHVGYAAFSIDFNLAQGDSDGVPFYAARPGRVAAVQQANKSGSGSINYITVQHETVEFADYLHLRQNSAVVAPGESVVFDEQLALIGDIGANVGAFHLHLAVTNIGEDRHFNGPPFVTIPAPYANYEVLNPAFVSGENQPEFFSVIRGVPEVGQWVRRASEPTRVRYAAVWQPGSYAEQQIYDVAQTDFDTWYADRNAGGWRLAILSGYAIGADVRHPAVLRQSDEPEQHVLYASVGEVAGYYDTLWSDGWRLKTLAPYTVGMGAYFDASWERTGEGAQQIYDANLDDLVATYDRLWPDGWRLKILAPYVINDEVRYAAAWSPTGEGEQQVYDESLDDLVATYDRLWPDGWRLTILAPYILGGQTRYAGGLDTQQRWRSAGIRLGIQ